MKSKLSKEQRKFLGECYDNNNDGTDYELTCVEELDVEDFHKVETMNKYPGLIDDIDKYLRSRFGRTDRGKILKRLGLLKEDEDEK